MSSVARRSLAILLGVVAVHVALLFYFAPREALSHPVVFDAYGSNVYQALRLKQGVAAAGVSWVYDPTVDAGRVAGAVRGLGGFVFPACGWLAAVFGLGVGAATNVAIVAMWVSIPLLGFASARAFRVGLAGSIVCAALWSALWYFDSLVHWTWYSGRIAWPFGVALAAFAVGLADRARTSAKAPATVACSVVAAAAAAAHPLVAPFFLVAVIGARAAGHVSSRRAAILSAAPIVVCALRLLLEGTTSDEPSGPIFRSTALQIATDFFEVLSDDYGDGGSVRTFFRLVSVAAGVVGLRAWGRRDPRVALLVPALGFAFLLAYLGGALPIAWPIDPYLSSVVIAFMLAIPAGALLADVTARAKLREMTPVARGALLVLALLVAPRAIRSVLTFMPDAMPDRVLRSPADPHVSALFGLNEPLPTARRLPSWIPGYGAVRELLARSGRRGRVAVDDPGLAAYLAVTSRTLVLGLPPERGSRLHGLPSISTLSGPALATFIRDYSIEWVVLAGGLCAVDEERNLFFPVQLLEEGYRVYRVREPSTPVRRGSGRIAGTSLDSITVDQAGGERLVLGFHYDPRLRCRPSCTVSPFARSDGPPFLLVERPPARFEIYSEGR